MENELEWIDFCRSKTDFFSHRLIDNKTNLLKVIRFSDRRDASFFCRAIVGKFDDRTYRGSVGGSAVHVICSDQLCRAHLRFTKKKDKYFTYKSHTEHTTTCQGAYEPQVGNIAPFLNKTDIHNSKSKGKYLTEIGIANGWSLSSSKRSEAMFRDVSKAKELEVMNNITQIEPFLKVFAEKNNSFYTVIKSDNNTFQRAMVLFLWAKTMELTSRVVAIDGCHMKPILLTSNHARIRKELKQLKCIALVTKSSENHNIILAFSLCHTEEAVEFSALLSFCVKNGLDLNKPSQTIISDRAAAIKSAIKACLPSAYHIFCPVHIKRNLVGSGFSEKTLNDVRFARIIS